MVLCSVNGQCDLQHCTVSGLSVVERRTFAVGMRWSEGRGRAAVDDMSLKVTVVPVCRVGGYSQCTGDSLTHVVI
jgi:hypothetical protein